MFDSKSFRNALTKYELYDISIWKTDRILRELTDCFGGEGDESDVSLYNAISILFNSSELTNLITHENEDDFVRIVSKISKENLMDVKQLWNLLNIITKTLLNKEYTYDELIEKDVSPQRTTLKDYVIENDTIFDYVGSDESILLPDKYRGKKIRKIASRAFMGKGLRSVIIPEGFTEIGENSFANNLIKELVLPDSLRIIEGHAFSENRLEELEIPPKIELISEYVFSRNEIKRVRLPDKLNEIKTGAFYKNNLRKLALPQGLKTIGINSFENNLLKEICFNYSINVIGNYAFKNNNIESICLPETVSHVGLYAFADNRIKHIYADKKIINILNGNDCFDGNSNYKIIEKFSDDSCQENIQCSEICIECKNEI